MATDYKIEPMIASYVDAVIEFWYEEGVILIDDLDGEESLSTFIEYNRDHQDQPLSLVAIANGQVEGAVLCGHDGRTAYIRHLAARRDNRECKRRLLNHCITGLSRTARLECCYFFLSGDTKGERPGDDIDSLIFLMENGWRIRSDVALMSYALRDSEDITCELPTQYQLEPMVVTHYDEIIKLWKANGETLNVHPIMDNQRQFGRFLERNRSNHQGSHSFVIRQGGGSQDCGDDVPPRHTGIVGTVQCGHDQRGAFLRKLVVDANHRQHGLGSHLIRACLTSIGQTTQVSRVYALIELQNIQVAKFYFAHGWDMRDDLLVFYKKLSRRGGD